MPIDFRYVPTSGDLSGMAFEKQTEQAFNELGGEIDSISAETSLLHIAADHASSLANQAVSEAQTATTTAQQAKQMAEQASSDISVAFHEASQATQVSHQALDMAAIADTRATDAQDKAETALTVATDAQDKATESARDAETALNMAQNAMSVSDGVYITEDEPIEIDDRFSPANLYLTNAGIAGLPVSAPAYLNIVSDDNDNTVTQRIWNADAVEYMRVADITKTINTGNDVIAFMYTPDDEDTSASLNEVTITSDGVELSVLCAGGTFVPAAATETTLTGDLVFPLTDAEDGLVSIGEVEVIEISGGEAEIRSSNIGTERGAISVKQVQYDGEELIITMTYTWHDVDAEAAWGGWQGANGALFHAATHEGGGSDPVQSITRVSEIANGGAVVSVANAFTCYLGSISMSSQAPIVIKLPDILGKVALSMNINITGDMYVTYGASVSACSSINISFSGYINNSSWSHWMSALTSALSVDNTLCVRYAAAFNYIKTATNSAGEYYLLIDSTFASSMGPYLDNLFITISDVIVSGDTKNLMDSGWDAQIGIGSLQLSSSPNIPIALPNAYCQFETYTGKKHYDGSRIYRKLIYCGALPDAATKSVAHGIASIKDMLSLSAFMESGTTKRLMPWITDTYTTRIDVAINNIRITTVNNLTAWDINFLVMEYTRYD